MPDNIGKFPYLQFDMNLEELSKLLLDEIKISPLKFESSSNEKFPMLYTFHEGTNSIIKKKSILFSSHLVPFPHVNLDYLGSSQLEEEIRNLIQKHTIEDIEKLIKRYLMGDQMADDILCPTCGHSMAFHKFDYGVCDAPLGGLTSKNVCGCGLSISTYILNMQLKDSSKEFEQLESKYKNCMEEIVNSLAVLKLAQKKIDFLESKLKTVRELIDKANPIEKANPIPGWFGIAYRSELIKLVNDITLELEKDMDNG